MQRIGPPDLPQNQRLFTASRHALGDAGVTIAAGTTAPWTFLLRSSFSLPYQVSAVAHACPVASTLTYFPPKKGAEEAGQGALEVAC